MYEIVQDADGNLKIRLSDTGWAVLIGTGIFVTGCAVGYKVGFKTGSVKTKYTIVESLLGLS